MDKKGAKIWISCIISALLIVVLLIVTIRFTHPSCELIIIESGQLRSSALSKFAKIKPIRSQEKSMLLKISAHLEYFSQSPSSQSAASLASQSTQLVVGANTQDYSQQVHQVSGLQQQQPTPNQLQHPQTQSSSASSQPSIIQQQQQQVVGNQQNSLANNRHLNNNGQANFVNNQMAQNSSNNLAFAVPTSVPLSDNINNNMTAKKFLPLELDKLDMKRIDSSRYKYTLSFNCSVIEATFVRNADRVYVSAMSVEMKLPNRGKNKCELQLPNQNVFDVKVYDGLAHYYCSRPLRYSCYHYSSKSPGQPGLLLADLHINSIEFETGGNSSHPIHKSHEFQSTRSKFYISRAHMSLFLSKDN